MLTTFTLNDAVFILVYSVVAIALRFKVKKAKLPVNWISLSFVYHTVMSIAYATISLHAPSDARLYFESASAQTEWLHFFKIGTASIGMIQYPLIHFFGLGWFTSYLFFNLLGYLGLFLVFKVMWDLATDNPRLQKIVIALMFIPGLNFWTSAIGKDSLIMLGIGSVIYASQKWESRIGYLVAGITLVGVIRLHVCATMLVAIVIAFLFSKTKQWILLKVTLVTMFVAIGIVLLPLVMAFVGVAQLSVDMFEAKEKHYANVQGDFASSVDTSRYNTGEKIFLYLFRPLFFDAKNGLMWIVSVENALLLFLFLRTLSKKNITFWLKSPSFLVRFNLIYSILCLLLLSFVCVNMGIAVRQKQMIWVSLFVLGIAAQAEKREISLAKT